MKGISHIIYFMLLAITVNSFVYFGFANTYSTTILNHHQFIEQFHSGIYQYRILSGYLLMGIYQFLGEFNLDYSIFKFKFIEENSEPRMYLALYLLNTIFLTLCSLFIYGITKSKLFNASKSEKIYLPTVAILIMAVTQFVIVPYDCSSYFFLALFIYLFLKYLKENKTSTLLLLGLTLALSTINRESSALSISFGAVLLYHQFGISKKSIVPTGIFVLVFIAIYLGLRLSRGSFDTNDGLLIYENFTQAKNLLGLIFMGLLLHFTLIICESKIQKKLIWSFLFFAIPYLAMCLLTGILYEVRLYVPIFLSTLVLSKIDLEKIKI